MAIVDPMSDAFTPLLSTSAKPVVFPPATRSDFEKGFDVLLANTPAMRKKEPPGEAGPSLDEVAGVLLDDIDVVDEGTDTDVLEGSPVHPQRARTTTARHALG